MAELTTVEAVLENLRENKDHVLVFYPRDPEMFGLEHEDCAAIEWGLAAALAENDGSTDSLPSSYFDLMEYVSVPTFKELQETKKIRELGTIYDSIGSTASCYRPVEG